MKTSITFFTCLLFFSVWSQNHIEKDKKGNDILLGAFTQDVFEMASFNKWYAPNYKTYEVNYMVLSEIKIHLKSIKISLFMGSWCGDSKRGVPQILKICNELQIKKRKLKMVALDYRGENYKKSPQGEEVGKNIIKVPTLILYKKGKEIGRIVENPKQSWELDILEILKNGDSKKLSK